jgi:hypothetical protein
MTRTFPTRPELSGQFAPNVAARPRLPQPGEVVRVTRAASVQFLKPILFRVGKVLPQPTYDGWAWLVGYQLNDNGEAVERREIYVRPAGLEWVQSL